MVVSSHGVHDHPYQSRVRSIQNLELKSTQKGKPHLLMATGILNPPNGSKGDPKTVFVPTSRKVYFNRRSRPQVTMSLHRGAPRNNVLFPLGFPLKPLQRGNLNNMTHLNGYEFLLFLEHSSMVADGEFDGWAHPSPPEVRTPPSCSPRSLMRRVSACDSAANILAATTVFFGLRIPAVWQKCWV